MSQNYGTPKPKTYGDLFGPEPALYGAYGAVAVVISPPVRANPPGGSGEHRRRTEKVWYAGTLPVKVTVRSVATHRVIVPMVSHREILPVATPLSATYTSWNDEQDLQDILRLIGMT